MAQDNDSKAAGSAPRRLARAKVKRPETEAEVQKRKADRKKTIRNIAVSVFAVILVLSMMVPSLASIVMNARNAKAASQGQTEVTAEQIDAMYEEGVTELEATLEKNPEDLETLSSLASQYMSWGYMVGSYVSGDEAAAHSSELIGKASEYYDRYLAIENDSEIRVNRAMCDLYAGDMTAAQTGLEAVVADDPDCASAWANLGLIYEMTNPDAAALAYERAIAADPDDEAGAKSYAQGRLDALNAATEETSEDDAVGETAAEPETTAETDASAETEATDSNN
jgi:Tfp pilus assembly protein PilF